MRRGYAQLPRGAVDVACAIERRRRTRRPQTALGAIADMAAEIDRARGPVTVSPRHWADRWGWHPQEVARLLVELAEIGWIQAGGLIIYPPDRPMECDGRCDGDVTDRDGDVTAAANNDAAYGAECDADVTGLCRDCDGDPADVTAAANNGAGSGAECDVTFGPLPPLPITSLTPPPPTPSSSAQGGGQEVEAYVRWVLARPGVRNPPSLEDSIRARIKDQGGLTDRDRRQMQEGGAEISGHYTPEARRTANYLKDLENLNY